MPKVKIGKWTLTHEGKQYEAGQSYDMDGDLYKAVTAKVTEGPRKGAYEHDVEEV